MMRPRLALAASLAVACSSNPRASAPCDPMGAAGDARPHTDGHISDPDAMSGDGDGENVAACDPLTQPAPDWAERDGECLASCDRLGGDSCVDSPTCLAGWVPVPNGPAHDCGACCVWGHTGGGCLDHCGAQSPDGTCECDAGCLVRGDCCDDYVLVCD